MDRVGTVRKLTRAVSHAAEYEKRVAPFRLRSSSVQLSQKFGVPHEQSCVVPPSGRTMQVGEALDGLILRAITPSTQVAASERVSQRALDKHRIRARPQESTPHTPSRDGALPEEPLR